MRREGWKFFLGCHELVPLRSVSLTYDSDRWNHQSQLAGNRANALSTSVETAIEPMITKGTSNLSDLPVWRLSFGNRVRIG